MVSTDVLGEGAAALNEEMTLAVSKARAVINQGLGDTPLRFALAAKENSHRMWNRLRERYAVSNVTTRVQLQSKLAKLSFHDQAMSDYIGSFEEVFDRLAAMGTAVSEEMNVATLLSSFGDKFRSPYGHTVASLQTFGNSLNWEAVTARLL